MKTLLGAVLSALGVLGIALDALKLLPVDFPLPDWALSLGTVLPLLLLTFGLQDDFDEGKVGILELIQRFLADPYRTLGITVLAVVAKGLIEINDPSSPLALGAQALLALLTAGGFIAGLSKSYARRELLKLARLNKFKVL